MSSEAFETKFRELQKQFLSAVPDDLATMRGNLQNLHDAAALKKILFLAHRYSGNGRTFGFPDISDAARPLELALQETPSDVATIALLFLALEAAAQASLAAAPVTEALKPVEEKKSSGHGKVLIADDDALAIQLLGTRLKAEGYQIISADSGQGAIDAAIRHKPALVLLDCMLPDIDGLTVLQKLKTHAATNRIPVIMVSGKKLEKNIKLGMSMGAADYVVKPFNFENLLERIAAALQ